MTSLKISLGKVELFGPRVAHPDGEERSDDHTTCGCYDGEHVVVTFPSPRLLRGSARDPTFACVWSKRWGVEGGSGEQTGQVLQIAMDR